ncbi:hypothetical protein Patl1_35548 [Pistacia atlantica]|nr:hypothetical protein Patl1_35548 [Pistacia atlantica]
MRDKGLCFRCNERYSPGHQCKHLFVIEACWPKDEDNDREGPPEVEGDSESTPEISFNAIFGACTPPKYEAERDIERRSFEVAVASGKWLTSLGQCNLVTLHIQGLFQASNAFCSFGKRRMFASLSIFTS